MSLTFSLLKPPLSTPFIHGSSTSKFSLLPSFSTLSLSSTPPPSTTTSFPIIKAMRSMQGRVICATNDKTVNVEVVRLAPHPKYKRRVRKKKKYQAHDPDNQFKVGDLVQLEKCRPISKTKTFLAVIPQGRKDNSTKEGVESELGIPLQSQQQEDKSV
ncbi:30S ribosomal protein S17, chloroplastic [Beta vulgaris subsp. vulgaris]|uniref:30S ribosomal protein S17, chloroplastic n=1 Tax=Beta vulgaris subsp. vulgaris TaxID=3555 RepID=UPI002036AFAC|nr:30S ribosomal protein S17, chloroplastic [Beta vulgaris subsp. vulgaris]